jgi:hypothetical protein
VIDSAVDALTATYKWSPAAVGAERLSAVDAAESPPEAVATRLTGAVLFVSSPAVSNDWLAPLARSVGLSAAS